MFYQNIEISAHKHRLMLKNKWTKPHVRWDLLQILYIPYVQRVPIRIVFSWTKRQAEGSLGWKCKKIYNFHKWWRATQKHFTKRLVLVGTVQMRSRKKRAMNVAQRSVLTVSLAEMYWSGAVAFIFLSCIYILTYFRHEDVILYIL